MEPQPQPQQTARQQLGSVLKFHREHRSLTSRRVADMVGCSREAIDNFENGHTVPDGKAWDKYCGIVNRRLPAFAELRQRALKEAANERDLIIRGMEQHKMATATNGHKPPIIGTNLGDKLVASTPREPLKPTQEALRDAVATGKITMRQAAERGLMVATVPPITTGPRTTAGEQLGVDRGHAKDGRRMMPDRPPGSMTRLAIEERKAWARLQLRQRPRMTVNGADGLLVLMRQRFGVGLDPDVCQKLRAEVLAEYKAMPPSVPAGVESAPVSHAISGAITMPMVTASAEITSHKDPGGDLEAAVQLVLGSLPNLRTFTITVDDNGEASVDYTMREVRVVESAGSLKVRR